MAQMGEKHSLVPYFIMMVLKLNFVCVFLGVLQMSYPIFDLAKKIKSTTKLKAEC